ncbi:MAG TPA: hypothetical protein VKP30_12930 [Polyangiaceae bacterium]|nr:hypothetical protein [Polyangiaceae bacterium]
MARGTLPSRQYTNEDALRTAAVEIARFACDGDNGRALGDPVFEAVTEGRAKFKGYSACGDLAQYTLAELGVTDETLINRDTDGGTEAWKMGKNLSRIVYQSGSAFVWAKVDLRPKPGDILYVAVPEHVCVLEKLEDDAGTISVFEYGQWDAKRQKPSGKRTVTKFSVGAKNLKVGNRTLRGWLDIVRIPGLLQSPRASVDSTLIA